jgi:hypothetical protein
MYYYAIYVVEEDNAEEKLLWFAYDMSKKDERKFFIGGSGIMACIFTTAQTAHAVARNARSSFDGGAQFHVRKVEVNLLTPNAGYPPNG